MSDTPNAIDPLRLVATAAAAPTTTATNIVTWQARGTIKIKFKASTQPDCVYVPVIDIEGIPTVAAGYLTAKIVRGTLILSRPPGTNVDVIATLTGPDIPYLKGGTTYTDEGTAAARLAQHPGCSVGFFRSTNTAIDEVRLPLEVPPGVSPSLIGLLSGLLKPCLAIGFISPDLTIGAATVTGYVHLTIESASQGLRY